MSELDVTTSVLSPEERLARARQKQRECVARYRINHAKKIRAADRAYRKKHPEKHRQYIQTWRAKHPEKRRAQQRKDNATFRAKHPEVIRANDARRRAMRLNAPLNDFTPAQWKAMKEHYDYRCVYCGKKQQRLTMDHITPLSKGGSHTLANIVPACQSCNSRKNAGAVLIPIQPLLLVG